MTIIGGYSRSERLDYWALDEFANGFVFEDRQQLEKGSSRLASGFRLGSELKEWIICNIGCEKEEKGQKGEGWWGWLG